MNLQKKELVISQMGSVLLKDTSADIAVESFNLSILDCLPNQVEKFVQNATAPIQ